MKAQDGWQVLLQLAASLANGGGKKWEKEKYVHMEKNTSCLALTFMMHQQLTEKKDNF